MRVLAGNAAPAGPRAVPPSSRFQTVVGQPYTIALQFATGKQVTSRYNNKVEVMYTLTTGQKAYFPLDVAAAIDSLTLAPGQPFTICHLGGNSWDIERAHPSQQPPQPHQYTPPQPQPHQPQQPPPPPYYPPPAAEAPARKMNGAGQTASEILLGLYPDAIEVALKAAAMAQAKGLMVSPTFEDVRTIATTLFINQTGGDR